MLCFFKFLFFLLPNLPFFLQRELELDQISSGSLHLTFFFLQCRHSPGPHLCSEHCKEWATCTSNAHYMPPLLTSTEIFVTCKCSSGLWTGRLGQRPTFGSEISMCEFQLSTALCLQVFHISFLNFQVTTIS